MNSSEAVENLIRVNSWNSCKTDTNFTKTIPFPYRIAWLIFVYLGAVGSLYTVWSIADTLNGLMALPNLVAILGSGSVVARAVRELAEFRSSK